MVEFSMILSYFINIMENKIKFRPHPGSKLMDQVRQVLRYHHYSYRTEKTYCDWIFCYIVIVHRRNADSAESYLFLLSADPRRIGYRPS